MWTGTESCSTHDAGENRHVSEVWPQLYPARYRDARGSEATVIENDGHLLRTVVRGVEFTGRDFDILEPPPELDADLRSQFTLAHGYLADCVIAWEMPLTLMFRDRQAYGRLEAQLDLGPEGPRGGLTQERLHLVLRWSDGVVASRGQTGWFESELTDLQQQLPEGASLRCCFTCALSDYSPAGHGLFGGLACFRDNTAQYLTVHSKADIFRVWPTMTEFVQETFLCPEYSRRLPGFGYRG